MISFNTNSTSNKKKHHPHQTPPSNDPLLIYNSLMAISNNSPTPNSSNMNPGLKEAVERQPLFQILSLNQKANSLIKNKTNFLTNSAASLVNTGNKQTTNSNSPPQINNNTNRNHPVIGEPRLLNTNINFNNYQQYPYQIQQSIDEFTYPPVQSNTSANTTPRNSRTLYKLDTNIQRSNSLNNSNKKRLELQTSPIEFANSIWSPIPNNTSSPTLSQFSIPSVSSPVLLNNNNNRISLDSDHYNNYNNSNDFRKKFNSDPHDSLSSVGSSIFSNPNNNTYSPTSTHFEIPNMFNINENQEASGILVDYSYKLTNNTKMFTIKNISYQELIQAYHTNTWIPKNEEMFKKFQDLLRQNLKVLVLLSPNNNHFFNGIAELFLCKRTKRFLIQFFFIKNLNFTYFQSIVFNNFNHSIINAKDGQEIEPSSIPTIIEVFKSIPSNQSFLTNSY